MLQPPREGRQGWQTLGSRATATRYPLVFVLFKKIFYVKGFFAFMPGTPLKLEEGVRVWNWGYGEL